jgi:hypothetical protein
MASSTVFSTRLGKVPELAFNSPQYEIGSERYLNVFRYFAKIFCCHVAESFGPRPLAVPATANL